MHLCLRTVRACDGVVARKVRRRAPPSGALCPRRDRRLRHPPPPETVRTRVEIPGRCTHAIAYDSARRTLHSASRHLHRQHKACARPHSRQPCTLLCAWRRGRRPARLLWYDTATRPGQRRSYNQVPSILFACPCQRRVAPSRLRSANAHVAPGLTMPTSHNNRTPTPSETATQKMQHNQ